MHPIIITGCARSGTSLVAGIFDRCGAQGGITCGPTVANVRGQYENNDIRNRVTKPFLSSIDADPMGQHPLPNIEVVISLAEARSGEWRKKVLDIVEGQGVNIDKPWYIKEAKACLIWPMWRAAFPRAKWIVVRRSDCEIVESCLRTHFMRAFREERGWHSWVEVHNRRFGEIHLTCDSHSVWSDELVSGDTSFIKAIIKSLELSWDDDAVKAFVDPTLYHRQGVTAHG